MPETNEAIRHLAQQRGITRLCHVTQARNLPHIFESGALLSTSTLTAESLPSNPNDPQRLDGYQDHISCSVEYPNAWYLRQVRSRELLFRDWVVLEVAVEVLWSVACHFSPVNAATAGGAYILGGIDGFTRLYDPAPVGSRQSRQLLHLDACATDDQAEVLVPSPIPLDQVRAVVAPSEERAQVERSRLAQAGLDPGLLSWKSSPTVFDPHALAGRIRSGERCEETLVAEAVYS